MSKQKHPPNKSTSVPSPQIPQADFAKSEKGAAVKLFAQQIREFSSFSGPLPPPEAVEYYNKIIPNGADRLLKMVELQSEHRRACEEIGLKARISILKRGQILAFLLSLVGFGIAGLCAYFQQPIPSTVIGGGTLLGLASLFIKGSTIRKIVKRDGDSKD